MPLKQKIVSGFKIEDIYQKVYDEGKVIKDYRIIKEPSKNKKGTYILFLGKK